MNRLDPWDRYALWIHGTFGGLVGLTLIAVGLFINWKMHQTASVVDSARVAIESVERHLSMQDRHMVEQDREADVRLKNQDLILKNQRLILETLKAKQ